MPSQKSMVAPSNTHLCLGLWLGGFPGPPPDVLPDPYPPPDPDGPDLPDPDPDPVPYDPEPKPEPVN